MPKTTTKKSPLAKALTRPKCTASHVIVQARAGTGKTTTIIEGLKLLKGGTSELTPSPQQQLIWDAIQESPQESTACFVAFNKSIATELQSRVPAGCEAMTMHSMGFKAIRNAFPGVKVNNSRVPDIIAELLGRSIREMRRVKFDVLRATEKLVSLCKMNLTLDCITNEGVFINEALAELVSHYDIELNGNQAEVFALVPDVLDRCRDVDKDGCIDFSDMIWLPVVLRLHTTTYDLLLVDEAQDLNRCQQELALQAGERLILVGDEKQAIYGFAGADSKSMKRMRQSLETTPAGCQVLPLTVTRRCGKAIVREAQRIVPDFEAHESCCNGKLSYLPLDPNGTSQTPYRVIADNGDMILCRVNAPLVSECFKFLRDGRRANIRGRDVGQGLISTIRKLMNFHKPSRDHQETVSLLISYLGDWLHEQQTKEQAKRNPSEARLIALQDRHDCILCFTESQDTVDGVIKKIESIFTDDKDNIGIMLSSVHKAKGLEAPRVFILQPEGAEMPHPMAKSLWQVEQEWNCLYIAITRAVEELVYVS